MVFSENYILKLMKPISGAEHIFVAILGGAPRDVEGAQIHMASLLAGHPQTPA